MAEPRDDPPPQPPEPPLASDCCGSGCARCVFEIHAEEQDHYRQALQAWQARQSGLTTDGQHKQEPA